jgi:hypothetical protein
MKCFSMKRPFYEMAFYEMAFYEMGRKNSMI